ncbi:phage recombination protein Bet [Acinetobacter variabilis]|uniref:Phage recombination protein Bet n=1 Tax=Acinetobacter variabilis TaxID=70346 RepID=N8WZU8_9GAMM|nr:phage recombination protein Bet [Acinetobacter variabilis]ENV00430.1 phage recombination protein Bet [Acinetobacter variabilis]
MTTQPKDFNSSTPLLEEFGRKFNIAVSSNGTVDTNAVAEVLIQTCFKQPVTYAQMTALLIVAKQYQLNPFTREIYAFPTQNGGIVPIVGVDGWCNMINSHPEFAGMEFKYSTEMVPLPDKEKMFAHTWCECILYRKDRERQIIVREYMGETYKPASVKNGFKKEGAWQSHPNRMLRHKTLIQCARYAFGFTGIYDPDEAAQYIHDTQAVEGVSVEVNTQQATAPAAEQQTETEAAPVAEQQAEAEAPPAADAKPPMPADRFDRNYQKAMLVISTGKATAQTLIDTMESSYSLTAEQKNAIIKLEEQAA